MTLSLSLISKRRKLPSEDINQTNIIGSDSSWKYTSKKENAKLRLPTFQRKKMTGRQARQTPHQQQELQQNGTKGHSTAGPTYAVVRKQPASQGRSHELRSESDLHYADIRVCSGPPPPSSRRAKHPQSENRTEYATLRFPQAPRHYDSKNGTLV